MKIFQGLLACKLWLIKFTEIVSDACKLVYSCWVRLRLHSLWLLEKATVEKVTCLLLQKLEKMKFHLKCSLALNPPRLILLNQVCTILEINLDADFSYLGIYSHPWLLRGLKSRSLKELDGIKPAFNPVLPNTKKMPRPPQSYPYSFPGLPVCHSKLWQGFHKVPKTLDGTPKESWPRIFDQKKKVKKM